MKIAKFIIFYLNFFLKNKIGNIQDMPGIGNYKINVMMSLFEILYFIKKNSSCYLNIRIKIPGFKNK